MRALFAIVIWSLAACGEAVVGTEPPSIPDGVQLSFQPGVWVAAKLGDGPWQRVSDTGMVTLPVGADDRYAVAYGLPGSRLNIAYLTRTELASLQLGRAASSNNRHRVFGEVTGATPGSAVELTFGRSTSTGQLVSELGQPAAIDYEMQAFGELHDVIVQEQDRLMPGETSARIRRMAIVRDVSIGASDVARRLDVDLSVDAVDAREEIARVIGAEQVNINLVTPHGRAGLAIRSGLTGAAMDVPWYILASGAQVGDLYALQANGSGGRFVSRALPAERPIAAQVLDLTRVRSFTGAVEASAPARVTGLSFSGSRAELNQVVYDGRFTAESGEGFGFLITAGYLAGATSMEFVLPTEVDGFYEGWMISPGTVDYALRADVSNLALPDLLYGGSMASEAEQVALTGSF